MAAMTVLPGRRARARRRWTTASSRRPIELTGLSQDKLESLIAKGNLKPVPTGAADWQFSRGKCLFQGAMQCVQRQAWTATYGDFHAPTRFGVVKFARLEGE